MTRIWETVLGRTRIARDTNFFDAGGSIPFADQLFREIQREFGRELPSATIFHAPTIERLAALLEQPALPQFSPVVPIKAGSSDPPIFIAHGLAGSVRFFELARYIQTGHSVYGIEAKGVDGLQEPFDRIEDMAALYIPSLRQVQSRGPYVLIGYSFGGLVALEMAQRIRESGEQVQLLVLVDTYPHPRYLSAIQRLYLTVQRGKRQITEIKQKSLGDATSYIAQGIQKRMGLAGKHEGVPVDAAPLSLARTTARVKECTYKALASYRPRFYPGKIMFVKSEGDTYFPSDPVPVWERLAEGIEVERVSGGHLDLIATEYESLGAILTRFLNQSSVK
jgi:acetoacetyl-CoA synthetase